MLNMPGKQSNVTNTVWQGLLNTVRGDFDFEVSPRGLNCLEKVAGQYRVPMPAFINLTARKVNVGFMFAEAAWIVSGSNRLAELTPYMKAYAAFSDDAVFMRGAYGPKVSDQLGWVVDQLDADVDTRQAVINIWRERPAMSKDIPCTLSMQFLVRNNCVHSVVTMRSHDIVKGFTYDVFTFSMVANAVRLLLMAKEPQKWSGLKLGNLTVTAGSLHLYSSDLPNVDSWMDESYQDLKINDAVTFVMEAENYEELIRFLWTQAEGFRK